MKNLRVSTRADATQGRSFRCLRATAEARVSRRIPLFDTRSTIRLGSHLLGIGAEHSHRGVGLVVSWKGFRFVDVFVRDTDAA